MDSSDSGWGLVIRRCEHGNETSDVTQGKVVLEQLVLGHLKVPFETDGLSGSFLNIFCI